MPTCIANRTKTKTAGQVGFDSNRAARDRPWDRAAGPGRPEPLKRQQTNRMSDVTNLKIPDPNLLSPASDGRAASSSVLVTSRSHGSSTGEAACWFCFARPGGRTGSVSESRRSRSRRLVPLMVTPAVTPGRAAARRRRRRRPARAPTYNFNRPSPSTSAAAGSDSKSHFNRFEVSLDR